MVFAPLTFHHPSERPTVEALLDRGCLGFCAVSPHSGTARTGSPSNDVENRRPSVNVLSNGWACPWLLSIFFVVWGDCQGRVWRRILPPRSVCSVKSRRTDTSYVRLQDIKGDLLLSGNEVGRMPEEALSPRANCFVRTKFVFPWPILLCVVLWYWPFSCSSRSYCFSPARTKSHLTLAGPHSI